MAALNFIGKCSVPSIKVAKARRSLSEVSLYLLQVFCSVLDLEAINASYTSFKSYKSSRVIRVEVLLELETSG